MSLFDFTSKRTKDGLKELGDIGVWLKYLYSSSENYIEVQNFVIKMDNNFNLVYVMKSRQPDGTYKEDYDRSICANSLSYKELLEITSSLKSNKKLWDYIKLSVTASINLR